MKNFKIISIGLAVVTAASLLLLKKCNKSDTKQIKKEAKQAYINPAFPFLEIPQRVEMLLTLCLHMEKLKFQKMLF